MSKPKIYLGIRSGVFGSRRQIFKSEGTPTQRTHGGKYNAVIGPFRTMRGAVFMRDHCQSNPHCRNVADAERLAKKYSS